MKYDLDYFYSCIIDGSWFVISGCSSLFIWWLSARFESVKLKIILGQGLKLQTLVHESKQHFLSEDWFVDIDVLLLN